MSENATPGSLARLLAASLAGQLETFRDAIRDQAAELTEAQLWTRPIEPGNSVGHLVLHLTGNLKYLVGARLGGLDYVRDRDREFTETSVPTREQALAGLDEAVTIFRRVVEGLTPEQLLGPHPEQRFGTVLNALVSVTTHFALHRGQISYIARLVKQQG